MNMYHKLGLALAVAGGCAMVSGQSAKADVFNTSYGWEDGNDILGFYGNLIAENSDEQANSGSYSLKMTEDPIGGTPQAYVAFVENLNEGDTISASFFAYDDVPGDHPNVRIWAHYADSGDVNSYRGSASGNTTYSSGIGWEQLAWDWVFDSDSGSRDAFVLEARLYSSDGANIAWVDDLFVEVDTTNGQSSITTPGGTVFVPAPGAFALLGLGGLVFASRRRTH